MNNDEAERLAKGMRNIYPLESKPAFNDEELGRLKDWMKAPPATGNWEYLAMLPALIARLEAAESYIETQESDDIRDRQFKDRAYKAWRNAAGKV